uniref:Uncharacterized protein n=1 Tax=Nothobranchius furzeri TaxID=105023 RepID=A0A1A7ZH64_NOTFU
MMMMRFLCSPATGRVNCVKVVPLVEKYICFTSMGLVEGSFLAGEKICTQFNFNSGKSPNLSVKLLPQSWTSSVLKMLACKTLKWTTQNKLNRDENHIVDSTSEAKSDVAELWNGQ